MIPNGLIYSREFISAQEETYLIEEIRRLSLAKFKFRGFTANRRTKSFGFHYSFSSFKLSAAESIPEFLWRVRDKAANLAGCSPQDLKAALVTEYPPGATIGWHRDVPPFDKVVGISLRSLCVMKFRRGEPRKRHFFNLPLEERSAYLISGEVRETWEHSIPAVKALRYSITFRSLKADQAGS
jgi:DNA oxidative demethylase